MARVSRKKQNTVQTQVDTSVRIWKTALYVRLSVEDNGKDFWKSMLPIIPD